MINKRRLILLPIFAMSIGMLAGCDGEKINSAISDVQSQIDDIKNDVDALKKQIEELKTQISSLQTEMNTKISEAKADYEKKISDADAEIAKLTKDLDDLSKQFETDKKALGDDYDAKIGALQSTYEAKVQEIETSIANVNASISSLQTEMNNLITSIQNDYNSKINDLTGRVATLEEVQTHQVSFDTKGAGEINPVVVIHGEKVNKPEDPVKAGSNFLGWYYHNEPWYFYGSVVTEDMTLEAHWELINYSATFRNDDGTLLYEVENLHYGETVTYGGETPIKPNQEEHYIYSFDGWDKDLIVDGNMEFIAQYEKTYAPYEERYLDAEGNILYSRYLGEDSSTKLIFNDEQVEKEDDRYYLEAEDGILSGDLQAGDGGHGGGAVGYIDDGCSITYQFTLNNKMTALLYVTVANTGARINELIEISINGEVLDIQDNVQAPYTNTWSKYEEALVDKIYLKQGQNEIVTYFKSGGFNTDYIALEDLGFDLSQEGVELPTKANEGTLQFQFYEWKLTSDVDDLFIYTPVFSEATIGLQFEENKVSGYNGSAKDIIIPQHWNDYVIDEIGQDAFVMCNIKSVLLPDTIVRIGQGAFYQCEKLETINFPNSVERIDGSAFQECTKLETISLNEGLTELGNHSFDRAGIKNLTFPSTLKTIDDNAFYGIEADFIYLRREVINVAWSAFASSGSHRSVIYCERESKPSTYDSSWAEGSVVIWGYQSQYEENGFKYALYEINDEKFAALIDYDEDTIADFELPEKVNGYTVNRMCVTFRGNEKLERVVIPDYVTSISSNAFEECTSLKYVYISGSVTSIGELAFRRCFDLETVVLNEGLKTTEYGVFAECYSLSSITLPESLQIMGPQLFDTCTSLTNINIPRNVKTMSRAIFRKSSITFVDFPETIRVIEESMFQDCGSLAAVVLPASLKSIGGYAFAATPAFKTIYSRGTEEQWNALPQFDGTNDQIKGTTKYFYSETEPSVPGNFWRYVEGVPTIW